MSDESDRTVFVKAVPAPATRPGAAGDAVLLAIYPAAAGMGRRFPLTGPEHLIGRREGIEIALEVEGVSRRHARIFKDESGWQIEDQGSTNGVYLNDEKVTRAPLVDGDLVKLGVAIMKFLSGDNIEAQYHEEIYKLSIIDALTGVHNKRYFLEFLDRELAVAARTRTPLSLIMVDIDHFKKINDTHGHLAGDAALKELCRRLRPRIRKTDLLARYGGEEFSVVLPATGKDGALRFADELRVLVEAEPFVHEDLRISCTISLGVAEIDPAAAGRPDELIARADANLYEAKRSGRNRAIG